MEPTNPDDPLQTTGHQSASDEVTRPEPAGVPNTDKVAVPDALQAATLPAGEELLPAALDWSVRTEGSLPAIPGYAVLEELGRGGMGVVYKARQVKANRLVALKMIRGSSYASLEEKVRFQVEAEAVARLQHPNIVQLHEVGEADGLPFFSLEFCGGGSLDRRLKEGKPAPSAAAELVETLARAMHYAHLRGVVHRDLKPANVLFSEWDADGTDGTDGTDGNMSHSSYSSHALSCLKITDFGLAKRLDVGSDVSKSGAVMGTPAYMAPEQAAGKVHDTGPAADVYSLGAILYECLTCRPPFQGNNSADTLRQVLQEEPQRPSRLAPKLPRDLETICLKCLEKDPARRYSDAESLADDLARWRSGEPIWARPAGRVERAIKWARRRPAVAALLLVTCLGVAGIVWKYLDAEEQRGIAERLADDFRTQKETAERAEQTARDEEARAKRELTRAEGLVYAGNLTQAQLYWQEGNAEAARERLDACRWDYRGWEHAHLRKQFDESCVTLKGHTDHVTCVCFTPDGKRVVSASGDLRSKKLGELKVWDALTGREILSLSGHSDHINCVSCSPDGARFASAGEDRTVKLWDAVTGREIVTLKGHSGGVRTLCYSPDGKRLASAGSDMTVKVWNAATGSKLFSLSRHTAAVRGLCFSPDGNILASASLDLTVKLWNAVTGEMVRTFQGHSQGCTSVAFSPDGKRLASASLDRTVKVWDAATGRELLTLKGHRHYAVGVCFTPDGKRLASASSDRTVKVWDAMTGQELYTLRGHSAGLSSVCFSPEGHRLASASLDRTVKLWDAARGQELFTLRGHTDWIGSATFSPDGKRIASACQDRTVRLWDAYTGQTQLTFQGHSNFVNSVCFSPDGKRIASGSGRLRSNQPGEVKVWDSVSGRELLSLDGHRGHVNSVCFSPDGNRLASASGERLADKPGEVFVWDVATGAKLFALAGHADEVSSIVFSPDGKRLASASHDQTGKVWDALTGRMLLTLTGHTGWVSSICFSPDGQRLASSSHDQTVKLWGASTGQELQTLKGHSAGVLCVCFAPDGSRLVSSFTDGKVKVWDSATGQDLLTLQGHTTWVSSLSFSPDGERLLTASHDQTVKVWDAAAGQDVLTFQGHTAPVRGLCFSPNGAAFASASADRTVKLWNTQTGQELHTLRGYTAETVAVNFSADGSRVISRDAKGELRYWDASTGQPASPSSDSCPAEGRREAVNLSRTLLASADGAAIRVIRLNDGRPPSALVFARRLNDPVLRRLWHLTEAASGEGKGEWFAAAHHLKQLHQLASPVDSLAAIRVRRLRAITLHAGGKAPPAGAKIVAEKPSTEEQALADAYHLLDWPPHALPWWLGSERHGALLRAVWLAEERLLRQ